MSLHRLSNRSYTASGNTGEFEDILTELFSEGITSVGCDKYVDNFFKKCVFLL